MRHLVKLRQAGKGMIALVAEDIISVKEVDPAISWGATVKVNTLHSEYYLMQPLDEICDIVNRARERAMHREMSGEMVIDKASAKRIKAVLENSRKYAISGSISAEEMQSGLAAYQTKLFKEVKPHEEKTENPFEVTESELRLFGLSKMDVLLRAIADPTLEVEVTIKRKKDALTISKSIELHDADTDDLMSIEVNSIEDYWLITKGDEEREKHPKANAIIRFDDGLTGLFRESPIQIRKKIREASLC